MSCLADAGEPVKCFEPDSQTGMSAAVVVEDCALLHTGQIFPKLPEADGGSEIVDRQIESILSQIDAVLVESGSGPDQCIKINFYVARDAIAAEVSRILSAHYSGDHKPAVSFVTTKLPMAAAVVAADAVGAVTSASHAASRSGAEEQVILRESGGIVPGGSRIYVAGQAEQSTSLSEATAKTLASLSATLRFLGRTDADMVQLKAFVMSMDHATTVRDEVQKFFGDRMAPPLILVEWQSSTTVPIEIELVAWGGPGDGKGPSVVYQTPPGMTTSPVYSRVATIRNSPTIYISGLYPENGLGDPKEPVVGEREVNDLFASLQQTLSQTGGDLQHLVKATYYVTADAAANGKLNELRPKYYDPHRPPAASKAMVAGTGHAGAGITMDMIAIPVSAAR